MSGQVIHLADENRFVINIDNAQAILSYDILLGTPRNRCNFNSTFVPNELRGIGLAEKLVRHGLRWAKSQDLQIEASCWYVQKFLTPYIEQPK
ncbi:GNAT family N-acetyltransferase [Shewanella abyssi]|uniref:GNAT family N-acetyltransferase n=1 Tax=Shewanella abyssi TaxID=311789 RepID=UPI003D161991